MLKSKKIILVVSIAVAIALLVFFAVFFRNDKGDDTVIVKENVNVITSEIDDKLQPINVTDNTLVFSKNPGYEVGDIIVAGITEVAPNGFVRRVLSVSEVNGLIEYKTEPAVLTDVFEEAHIIKIFAITEEGLDDVQKTDDGNYVLQLSVDENTIVKQMAYSEILEEDEGADIKIKPTEKGLGFEVEYKDEIADALEVDAQFEILAYLEVKIDIEDGEIDFGVAVHIDTEGEVFAGVSGELFGDDAIFDDEYEKELFSRKFPNYQFWIGAVPVVITNDFEVSAEISPGLEGSVGTSIGLTSKRAMGFEYSSRTGEIQEINEKEYYSNGMDWMTEARVEGELEAGIYAHIITKLYDSTGADLAIGIAGNVEGEAAVFVDKNANTSYYGELDLSVGPKATGSVVVTVPVVDHTLFETELFKVSFPPFWEKHWEMGDPILQAMLSGDYSYFAGEYIATPQDVYLSGNGENIPPLELNEDGSLDEGVFTNSLDSTPISVEGLSSGAYLCMLSDSTGYKIYPVGVWDGYYKYTNASYLKDIVYIEYLYDMDLFGSKSITYYADGIGELVTNCQGADWVDKIVWPSDKFVSGRGIKYEVVEFVNNGTILQTQDGKKWIMDTPTASKDPETGILYYNIMEYSE